MTTEEPQKAKNQIFDVITSNDVTLLKTLLVDKENVDVLDENMMTPLQHACYKGNKEMVQLIIDQGADVNLCKHQHGYTALHFAGLSGNSEVCQILLHAGAKTHTINTVSRNAAQMAAFVGNHACVATINSFVPKSDVEYYTVLQGQQTNPYLPPFLCESLHKFITQINVHPVRIAINLHRFVGLVDHCEEVKKVLELMCEREIKRGPEANEVLSFKFHYLSCVVNEAASIQKSLSSPEDKKTEVLDLFARKFLKAGKEGSLDYMEIFLKESIRAYPYRECTIFRQMIASLSGANSLPALNVITSAINGQRGFVDQNSSCDTCGVENPPKKCSKCKSVQYCDRECQRLHWSMHKKSCAKLAQEACNSTKKTADLSEIQNLIIND